MLIFLLVLLVLVVPGAAFVDSTFRGSFVIVPLTITLVLIAVVLLLAPGVSLH